MKSLTLVISAGACLWATVAHSGTVCSSKEFPDHVEAVCVGDEKLPVPKAEPPAKVAPVQDVNRSVPNKAAASESRTQEGAAVAAAPSSADQSVAQRAAQRAAQWSVPAPPPVNPPRSESSGKFRSYLNNNPIQTGWSDKLAVRMRLIQQERQSQPAQ